MGVQPVPASHPAAPQGLTCRPRCGRMPAMVEEPEATPMKRMRYRYGEKPVAEWLDPFANVWATAREHSERIGVPWKTMRRRLLERGPSDPNTWRGEDIRCVLVRDPEGNVRSIEEHGEHYGIRPDTLRRRGIKWGWKAKQTWSPERISTGPPLITTRKKRYDKPKPKAPARVPLTPEQRRERKRQSQARWRERQKAERALTRAVASCAPRKPRKAPSAPKPAPTPPVVVKPPEPPRVPTALDKDTWRNPFPTLQQAKPVVKGRQTAEEALRSWADECGFGRHLR